MAVSVTPLRRVEKSVPMLSTQLPVKSVAARVGYTSVSAFIKRFRERYGVEPSRVAN